MSSRALLNRARPFPSCWILSQFHSLLQSDIKVGFHFNIHVQVFLVSIIYTDRRCHAQQKSSHLSWFGPHRYLAVSSLLCKNNKSCYVYLDDGLVIFRPAAVLVLGLKQRKIFYNDVKDPSLSLRMYCRWPPTASLYCSHDIKMWKCSQFGEKKQ